MSNIAIIGIGIVVMACLGALILLRRHPDAQQTQVKAVLFGLYFWGLMFLQLIICGLAYKILTPN